MSNQFPLVSVVMAAYNEEKHIVEAIESILNQTYPHFEFIIIDDGSTDRTAELIHSFLDPRIVYVKNEKNLKLIASLNKGLSLTKGKYIARMDADDISLPERFQKQVDFMEANPQIGISGAQLIVFGTEDSTMNYPLCHEDLKLRLLITSCFPNNLVIFRKEIMEKHNLRFPEGYYHGEDYKFWTQWLMLTEGANLPDYLVKYRFHPLSVSHKFKGLQRETRNRVRKEYVSELFFKDNKVTSVSMELSSLNYNVKLQAIKKIIEQNKTLKLFNKEKLGNTLFYLWYLDSLENIAKDRMIGLKFIKIFDLSFSKNFNYWRNIIKSTMKYYLGIYNE